MMAYKCEKACRGMIRIDRETCMLRAAFSVYEKAAFLFGVFAKARTWYDESISVEVTQWLKQRK